MICEIEANGLGAATNWLRTIEPQWARLNPSADSSRTVSNPASSSGPATASPTCSPSTVYSKISPPAFFGMMGWPIFNVVAVHRSIGRSYRFDIAINGLTLPADPFARPLGQDVRMEAASGRLPPRVFSAGLAA